MPRVSPQFDGSFKPPLPQRELFPALARQSVAGLQNGSLRTRSAGRISFFNFPNRPIFSPPETVCFCWLPSNPYRVPFRPRADPPFPLFPFSPSSSSLASFRATRCASPTRFQLRVASLASGATICQGVECASHCLVRETPVKRTPEN